MIRLLPILALALLPGAVAAPVPPRSDQPPFGLNGLLSEADLEKVVFASQPVPRGEVARVKRPERALELRNEPKPKRPRAENEYDVAVHIPNATFREGGPAPAYFVLRNNRGHELELYSRLDLVGCDPTPRGDSRPFDIRDRKTGKSVRTALMKVADVSGHSVEVPADGFYCQKVDLNRLSGDTLPPGEYEVEWRYEVWRAKPVPFTVLARDDGRKPVVLTPRPMLRYFQLTEDLSGEDRVQKANEKDGPRLVAWDRTELDPVDANDFAAALAVGQTGVYVPDVYEVPAADNLVAVDAVFKPYRDGDRIAVTLRAVPPHKEVEFNDQPQLYLQLETTPGPEDGLKRQRAARAEFLQAAVPLFTTPLTIEARLPAGWRDQVEATGPAQVSVLVASKKLDIPEGGLQRAKRLEARQERAADGPPVWSGVLRTGATAVHLPPPLDLTRR